VEHQKFDDLSRVLATALSRRGAVSTLAGLFGLGLLGVEQADGKSRQKRRRQRRRTRQTRRDDRRTALQSCGDTFGEAGQQTDQALQGLAVSADGRTMWVPSNQRQVVVWSRPTRESNDWRQEAALTVGGLAESVAVAPDGRTIWISDYFEKSISMWTRSTPASTDWQRRATFGDATRINDPSGLAATADGLTLLVMDSGFRHVTVWTRSTASSFDWSFHSSFAVSLWTEASAGIAISADGQSAWIPWGHEGFLDSQGLVRWTRSSATGTDWRATDAGIEWGGIVSVALASDGLTLWALAFERFSSHRRLGKWTRQTTASGDWKLVDQVDIRGYAQSLAVTANGQRAWVRNEQGLVVPYC
jgi:hypothetical protein